MTDTYKLYRFNYDKVKSLAGPMEECDSEIGTWIKSKDVNAIKAEGIREALENIDTFFCNKISIYDITAYQQKLTDYANKLEGE